MIILEKDQKKRLREDLESRGLYEVSEKFKKYAKIIHPPIKLNIFLTNLIKHLKRESDTILKTINTIINLPEELMRDYILDFFGSSFSFSIFEKLFSYLDYTHWKNFINKIESTIDILSDEKFEKYKYIEYITNYLQNAKLEIEQQYNWLSQELLESEERWKYQIQDQYLINSYSEVPKNLAIDITKIPEKLNKLLFLIDNALEKLNELLRFRTSYSGQEQRPKSENVEILYHTSVNAAQIARIGFQMKEQVEPEGLGGATSGISFTSDLYTAKEIARSLKEVIMIIHGQVKAKDVLSWANEDGVKEKTLKTYQDIYGSSSFDDAKDIIELYKVYLTLSQKRYNPVYVINTETLISTFQQKKYSDIGIIKAEIDMTNPKIQYLSSMHEYRVPPEAVIKIVGLLQ